MKTLTVIIILASSICLKAQIEPTGGFGGPIITIGQIDNNAFVTVGGGGGVILNHRFMVGGFGEGTVSNLSPKEDLLQKHYFEISSGGLWLGYSIPINKKHHISASAFAGFGRAYLLRNAYESYFDNISYVRPTLEYEFRVNRIVGIAAGLAWPLYADFDLPYYKPKALSKPAASITLKFGWLQ
ncbi:MAG: hypothetical protein PF489_03190 [Salinivirgaceae bacterium]|jgi:hypothetical protein|nr:hypothetical protein [Salinivirgaceae bacterium]